MTIGKKISNANSIRPLTVLKINVPLSPCLVAINVKRIDSDGKQQIAWNSLDARNSTRTYQLVGNSSTYCQLSCMLEKSGTNYINLYGGNLISWFQIQDLSKDTVLSVYSGTYLDEVTSYGGKNKVFEDIREKGVSPTGSFSGVGNIFYGQKITNINILGKLQIKRLNHCSFSGCTNLRDIDGLSGSSIEYMGERVFQNCSSLSNVNSLSNLHLVNANIPYGCFHGCSKITNLDVLSNCTFVAIGMGTTTVPTKTRSMNCFNGCSKLQNLDFLKSSTEITGIGNSIFSGCASLTSIDGLSSLRVDYIPSGCFAGCSKITSVNALSNCYTIKSLESAAFNGCKELTSLEPLKFDINTIPSDCFQNCWKLENLDVFKESHITSLNHACLQYCKKLQNLDFLENSDIKTITGSYGALQGCSELTSIDGLRNSHISVLTNPYAFSGLAMQNIDALSNMTVSAMAHSIFSSCSKLQNINGLSGCQLTSIPYALLQMCGSLNDVTPLKNMPIKSIEGNIINGSNALRKMEFNSEIMSINKDAFYTSNTRTLSVYFNGNTAHQLRSMSGFPFRLNGTRDWLICKDGVYHGGWIS